MECFWKNFKINSVNFVVFKSFDDLIRRKLNLKFLLASMKTVINYKILTETLAGILFRAGFQIAAYGSKVVPEKPLVVLNF